MRPILLLLALSCGSAYFDDDLFEARSAWNVIEMCPAQLYVREQSAVAAKCAGHVVPEGNRIEACSKIRDCAIYVSDDLEPERREQVLMHELGHLLKGKPGHLACADQPGDDVMCPAGAMPGTEPTDRDRAFVRDR